MDNIQEILNRFPKKRNQLPEEYQKIYGSHYKINREGLSKVTYFTSRIEGWMHKAVANDVNKAFYNGKPSTLEIGAGTLNHINFEPISENYIYDVIEPFTDLFKSSTNKEKINNFYLDISDVPIKKKYDRIISIATFEHLCDLPFVVARSGLLLNQNGILRVAIPSEGTLLWTLGWKLTTGIEYRIKYGLDYSVLMKYEHINTAKEIESILNYFFSEVKCKVFGINKELSFYQYSECYNPRIEKCVDYLNA